MTHSPSHKKEKKKEKKMFENCGGLTCQSVIQEISNLELWCLVI